MENLWDFFIDKVRKNLHIVLCFSPVGDKFRIRARQFPALVNCTMFDCFHGWPNEALVNVAQRFLTEVPNMEVSGSCAGVARAQGTWCWGCGWVSDVGASSSCVDVHLMRRQLASSALLAHALAILLLARQAQCRCACLVAAR